MPSKVATQVVEIIRELLKTHGELVQSLAAQVAASAELNLDTVDSQIVLDILKKSNERIVELSESLHV